MAEYIDRRKLKADLILRWNVSDDHDFCNKEVWHALEEVPVEDVVERKTGKWIEIRIASINPLRDGVYVGCSECHAPIPADTQLDFIDESDCKFCYNCGAKMIGGDEDV